MTSVAQDKAFIGKIAEELPESLLGTVIDFIRDELNPDQVFSQDRLNRFVGETVPVEEVFKPEELEGWALENGFVKVTNSVLLEALIEISRLPDSQAINAISIAAEAVKNYQ